MTTITVRPSPQSVADNLVRALQEGDVALVMTRRQLGTLIGMVEAAWASGDEFDLLQKLHELRDARR